MSTVLDSVDNVRDELRTLHKKIDASTAKNHAAIRADLEEAGAQAQRLAASLKTAAKDQRTDASDHLAHAASLLEQAATSAKQVSSANAEALRASQQDMLNRTRAALQSVSNAIAAKRSTARKQHA